jgi:hypothetical protein
MHRAGSPCLLVPSSEAHLSWAAREARTAPGLPHGDSPRIRCVIGSKDSIDGDLANR